MVYKCPFHPSSCPQSSHPDRLGLDHERRPRILRRIETGRLVSQRTSARPYGRRPQLRHVQRLWLPTEQSGVLGGDWITFYCINCYIFVSVSHCAHSLRFSPYDIFTCSIEFGSCSFHTEDLDHLPYAYSRLPHCQSGSSVGRSGIPSEQSKHAVGQS